MQTEKLTAEKEHLEACAEEFRCAAANLDRYQKETDVALTAAIEGLRAAATCADTGLEKLIKLRTRISSLIQLKETLAEQFASENSKANQARQRIAKINSDLGL